MAETLKIELDRAGVRELMRSREMSDICAGYAHDAQDRLGTGYEVTLRTGKNRVNAEVAAVSEKAKQENSRSNTILKALHGKEE